jgi:hypothetical protein
VSSIAQFIAETKAKRAKWGKLADERVASEWLGRVIDYYEQLLEDQQREANRRERQAKRALDEQRQEHAKEVASLNGRIGALQRDANKRSKGRE